VITSDKTPFDVGAMLLGLDPNELAPIITLLNKKGLIFSSSLESIFVDPVFKRWSSVDTKYLHAKGYSGGELEAIGQYFKNYSMEYCLFDLDIYAHEEIRILLEERVNEEKMADPELYE
jgi:hypothetical protein